MSIRELGPTCLQQKGFSLVEMVLSVVVVGIVFSGTLQLFGTLLKWSVYPMVEKQAIAVAQTVFQDKTLFTDCQSNIQNCQQHIVFKAVERYPFYQDATHYQYVVKASLSSAPWPIPGLKILNVELTHDQGDSFRFSRLQR